MVLGVVVVVLCSRVYEVLRPEEPPPTPEYDFPESEVPRDSVARAEFEFPDSPSLPPARRVPEVWKPLWERSPFWYNAQPGQEDRDADGNQRQDPGIRLLAIAERPDGSPRAQLRTASSKKWYDEGEEFEKYVLISIDPENKQCEVYSEELRERHILKIQR